jgi:TolB-like protein/Flp pilus assembly protein TadD
MTLAPGTRLGPHEIVGPLGAGGMGEVYRARDTRLGRDVAIKVLPQRLSSSPNLRERFEREARTISSLNHPNICVLHDVGREGEIDYLVMELVEGKTLDELISQRGLPPARLLDIAVQLVDALGAAHAAGVTHRDLKPANIMVSGQGRVKVLDFGLAKIEADAASEAASVVPTRLVTEEGKVLGTAPYMSPEQALGKPLDHRTDIFSMGTILFEMATGRRPFQGESSLEYAAAILRDAPPSVSDINPTMPRHLGRIIAHCLEKDPRDRFQAAQDLKYEIVGLKKEVETAEAGGAGARVGGGGVSARTAGAASASASAGRRPWPRWWPAVAVLAAAAALGLAIVTLRPGANRSPDRAATATPPSPPSARAPGAAGRTMVVVLPFENLGSAEDAYFAAGMTEEFTSRLARVAGLGVISRTSAVQYDRSGKTMRQIGEDLGVDYVLEGTVRWDRRAGAASRVRVTPQLIRVADDTHVWSDTYDRDIDDLFSVQSEIATNVVRALGVTLLEPERNALEARPTENLEAYQAYVRGKEYADQSDYTEENFRLAIRLLERAVELDPNFALAWAALSKAYSEIHHFGYDQSAARIAQSRAAADRALALGPDLPEVQLADGYYYYWIHRDYPRALEAFARAERSLPNDSEVLGAVAYIWRRQGRFEDAAERLKKAFELSPKDATIPMHICETLVHLRRYREAEEYADRAIALAPDRGIAFLWKGKVRAAQGDLVGARKAYEASPSDPDGQERFELFKLDVCEHKFQAARDRLEAWSGGVFENQWIYLPKSLLMGQAWAHEGDQGRAKEAFEAARARLERDLAGSPDDHRMHSALGLAMAGLGRKDEAIREGKRGVELYPVSKDALIGPKRIADLAEIYLVAGETDAALDQLERAVSSSPGPWVQLEGDPAWDPVRGHPRFKKLLERVAQPL